MVDQAIKRSPIRSEKLGKILRKFSGYRVKAGMILNDGKEEKVITSNPVVDLRWNPKLKEIILILESPTKSSSSIIESSEPLILTPTRSKPLSLTSGEISKLHV